MIVKYENSPLPQFRYELQLSNGKKFFFGHPGVNTYIDGQPKTKRNSYYRNLKFKPKIYYLVKNLIPHRRTFESRLLWGPYRDIERNIYFMNKLYKKKEIKK